MTRRIAAGATTAAAAVLLCGAVAPAAQAQTSDRGTTTVTLDAKALSALKKQGVTVAAVKPAKLSARKLTLPVARGALGTRSSWLEHDGGVTFRRKAGGKTLKVSFSDLRATLGATSTISASAAGVRVSLFTVAKRTAAVNAGASTATLRTTKVTLTTKAAALLRKRLKLKKAPTRAVGTVAVDAALRGRNATSTAGPGAGGGTSSGSGSGSGSATATTPGAPTTGNSEITTPEPPRLARPGGETPLAGAEISWRMRESWIQYLAAGDGDSDGTVASGAASEATATVAPGSDASLVYDFGFGHVGGSWTGGNQTALYFGGGVRFTYPNHQIDQTFSDPEIELNGSASRMIVRVDGPSIPAKSRGRRVVLLDLSTVGITPKQTGAKITWENIPAKVSTDASTAVFGGMSQPGSDWGRVTVSYQP